MAFNSKRVILATIFVIVSASRLHGFVISPSVGRVVTTRKPLAKRLHLSQDTKESTVDKTLAERGFLSNFRKGDSSNGTDRRLSLAVSKAQDALSPAAQAIDDATDGWALSYADLSPETESSPIGQAFLATNLAYALVGFFLGMRGDILYGFLVEIVSIASFGYHYTQLQASSNREKDSNVRLALMIDYFLALSAIFVGIGYTIMDQQLPPLEGIASGGIGVGFLLACWVWEEGLTYIILHGLWHFFSAYCGYVVGIAHQAHLSV